MIQFLVSDLTGANVESSNVEVKGEESAGMMEYWSDGVTKHWNDGVLECWSDGIRKTLFFI
jgi:hypothetical protein